MATVGPEDDSIRRFIALHHRYDQQRHEWRDVVLAAFDDAGEFRQFVDTRIAELVAAQATGESDLREEVSGIIHEPGHQARSRNQRLLRRALAHGVWPAGWDPRNPPEGVSVVSVGDPNRPA